MTRHKPSDSETLIIQSDKKVEALEQQARDLARSVETVRQQTLAQSNERIEALEQKARDLADFVETLRNQTRLQSETEIEALGEKARDLALFVESVRKETHLQSETKMAAMGQKARDLAVSVETVREMTLLQSDSEIATLGHAQEKTIAMNEALMLGSLRQHELTETAENLNAQLRAEITQRNRVEDALRESDERYRTLFDSSPMAVFVCDVASVIQNYNARAVELWGREPTCGVEKHCGSMKLWLPDGTLLPHDQSPMVEVLRTGVPAHNVEVYSERPDGSRLPVLVNFAALKNAQGEVTGAITSFIDITERKQAEEALRESEKQLLTLADSIPQLAWMAEPDGFIFWYNRRWYDYTGTTPEAMEGWGWESVHDPEILPKVVERWKHSIATGELFEMEFRLLGKDGEFRWFLTRMFPLLDTAGNIVRWFGTNTDIHVQKEAEEILRRSGEELEKSVAERTAELADANESLKAESEELLQAETERVRLLNQIVTTQEDERRRIARDLHDELGQQLTALRLKLKNAKEICTEGPVCDEIDATQAIAERIDTGVGFLAWELRPAALVETGLPATLDGYVKEWGRFSSVKAEFHEKGLGKMRLDPDMEINLYRIVQEALNNAHKYARAKNVSVMLEKQKYDVSLIIEDDGIGFNPDRKRKGKNGLGLIGMGERAALLGGHLEIESSRGAGTTIFLRVPVKSITNKKLRITN